MSPNAAPLPENHGPILTDLENTEAGFTAQQGLADDLQAVLMDLIDLSLAGKQLHWNVVGTNFRDLHLNLDEVVAVAREGSDEIAERMRALHVTPDGRTAVVAATSTLPDLPQSEVATADAADVIVQAIEAATGTMRRVRDSVDEADPASADILHEYIQRLEQQAWFIAAENRKPSTR